MHIEKLTHIGEILSALGGGQHREKFVNFIEEERKEKYYANVQIELGYRQIRRSSGYWSEVSFCRRQSCRTESGQNVVEGERRRFHGAIARMSAGGTRPLDDRKIKVAS